MLGSPKGEGVKEGNPNTKGMYKRSSSNAYICLLLIIYFKQGISAVIVCVYATFSKQSELIRLYQDKSLATINIISSGFNYLNKNIL